MTQLAIDLPHRPAFGRADFLVSECNAAALQWIERWPDWPARSARPPWPGRFGQEPPRPSVARAQRGRADRRRRAVAAADRARPPSRRGGRRGRARARAGPAASLQLLQRGRSEPSGGGARGASELADRAARSRLAAARRAVPWRSRRPTTRFSPRCWSSISPTVRCGSPPAIIGFLVRRMERSFAAAGALAERLDRLALGAGRPITLTLARRALADLGEPSAVTA